MRLRKFDYKKESTGEASTREVLVLQESKELVEGIDLGKLDGWERKSLMAIQEEYEKKMKPFIKAYRRFKKENVTAYEEITDDAGSLVQRAGLSETSK
jgi:2-oxo-4-hydroxy-4-carboxy--5-ureidoimidazoline (OHCU) decarboxylase